VVRSAPRPGKASHAVTAFISRAGSEGVTQYICPSPKRTDWPWGGKWPGREVDHSPPSTAEVKNTWSCTSPCIPSWRTQGRKRSLKSVWSNKPQDVTLRCCVSCSWRFECTRRPESSENTLVTDSCHRAPWTTFSPVRCRVVYCEWQVIYCEWHVTQDSNSCPFSSKDHAHDFFSSAFSLVPGWTNSVGVRMGLFTRSPCTWPSGYETHSGGNVKRPSRVSTAKGGSSRTCTLACWRSS
jgi:hypothetical protein